MKPCALSAPSVAAYFSTCVRLAFHKKKFHWTPWDRTTVLLKDFGDYGNAAAMLRALGADRVRLLTNNPSKVEGLEAAGITVAEHVAHQMPANPHNADYLFTKRKRSGHLLA